MNVVDLLLQQASSRPEALAVRHRDEVLGYGALGRRVSSVAAALASAGVVRGDVLALCLDDPLDHLLASLAAAHRGATVVSVPRSMPEALRARLLALTRAGRALADDGNRGGADIGGLPVLAWSALDKDGPSPTLEPAGEVADQPWIYVTGSGSTGRPKILPVTHRQQCLRSKLGPNWLPYGAQDVLCSMVSMHFYSAKQRCLEAMVLGAGIFLDTPGRVDLRREVAEGEVTVIHAMVSHIETLLRRLPAQESGAFARLQALMLGGSTVSMALRDEIRRRLTPRGGNTPRFLRAAHELGIPVMALAFEGYQYGHGARAQWLESTLTLQTPGLAVALARDKLASAARLRQAGLPVPAHQAVSGADEAVRVASRLGYPVVVKPVDRDGGLGVSVGLETEDEVRMAFAGASAVSARVLVEKHVVGRDYRLTVLDGKLLWAIERIPAGVIGDGVSTVEELVARENQDPRRGDGPHAALKRLALDDEARRLLAVQSLAADAVPACGQEVRLRRIANVNGGGRPVAVNERVHPDNAALAVHAVEALRLDLAGVDLLIPDIARSWRETGAAICEINAQPQLGATTAPHLYGEILRSRLGGDGRIPIVVILGDAGSPALSELFVMQLRQRGWTVGWCDRRGAGVDDEWLVRDGGIFASGQVLLTHPRVDALVLAIHDDELLQTGLPMDRFHWLVLAGDAVEPRFASGQRAGGSGSGSKALLDGLLTSLLPACSKRVLFVEGSGFSRVGPAQGGMAACAFEEIERERLLDALEQFPA